MSKPIWASPRFVQICGIIRKTYSTSPNKDIPVSVLDWKKIIETRLSKHGKAFLINVQSFPPQGNQIKGTLNRYKSHADIFFSDKETFCWQRYIVAKELAHLLIDTPAEYTVRPSSLMEQLVSGIPLWLLRRDHSQDDAAFDSEMTAMVAGIEMLLPWEHRPHFQKCFEQGKDNLEIAEEFKVPKYVVSNMLTPTYFGASQSANDFFSDIV